MSPGRLAFLRWYYLATPLFWLAGAIWGVHVRVAFLDDFPAGRNAYYVLCFLIGVVALRAPQYARRLALVESAANLGLLVLSVGLWYLRMLDWAASPLRAGGGGRDGELRDTSDRRLEGMTAFSAVRDSPSAIRWAAACALMAQWLPEADPGGSLSEAGDLLPIRAVPAQCSPVSRSASPRLSSPFSWRNCDIRSAIWTLFTSEYMKCVLP